MKSPLFKAWSWLLTIPLALASWWYGMKYIHSMDSSAGQFDWGIFEVPLMVLVFALIYKTITLLIVKLSMPSVFSYYLNRLATPTGNSGLGKDLSNLTSHQRIWVFVVIFFLVLFFVAYLSMQMLGGGAPMPQQLPKLA